MSLVILFCGIPASGKSTLCQAIADRLVEEESINSETEILSFDKFEVNKGTNK